LTRFVPSCQHCLQQVRWRFGSPRILIEPLARGSDQLRHALSQVDDRPLDATIRRRAQQPPEGQRRRDPPGEPGKDQLELLLQPIIFALDGVDVMAEREQRRGVHRQALELAENVERGARAGLPAPA
jgi:hypothetical protein